MKRWVVHATTTFRACHALRSYRGQPEQPHDHDWRVTIRVGCDELNAEGYALDFEAVRATLEEVTAPLHGGDLGRHPLIGSPTPSAERLAQVLAAQLRPVLSAMGGTLLCVSVWEGPENRVDLNLREDHD